MIFDYPVKLLLNEKKRIIEIVVVLLLSCFPIFYRLDALAIRQWDEARNAVSALEMSQNHAYWVRYFNGVPDEVDTKPPLLIWLQVLSFKLLGMNELAIRLPSALSALATALFLIIFLNRQNSRLSGYLVVLILVSSPGYIDRHMARTGDHDALLVLFTTLIVFQYYQFLIGNGNGNRSLLVITALFFLGFLTKGIAVFMILPGLLLATFLFGLHRKLFLNRMVYCSIAIIAILCLSYYLLREQLQPGYIKAVWSGELLPRYVNRSKDFLDESFWYYLHNLAKERFSYWIYLLIPSTVLLPLWFRKIKHSLPVYLLIHMLTYLFIISAGSKNLWYDGPLFPLLAAFTAIFIDKLREGWQVRYGHKQKAKVSIPVFIIPLLFIWPGLQIM
jgi:4-amino-4-deoxy-L-arabinose transferase-like glycosyltransferase